MICKNERECFKIERIGQSAAKYNIGCLIIIIGNNMAIKKSFIQIQEELKVISSDTLKVELQETDKFNRNSLLFFTHNCGYRFNAKLGNILSGKSKICPKCNKSTRSKNKKELLELITNKSCKLIDNNEDQLYLRYKYNFELSCGCIHNRTLYSIIKSTQEKISCMSHIDKSTLTLMDIQNKLRSLKYGSFKLLSNDWKGWKGLLKYQCDSCSSIFEESMAILRSRDGKCKNCFGSVNSIKEVYCNILLTDLEIKFQSQYYLDKYPFDFYLPEFNTLIEIDGKQHITSTFKGMPFKNNDEIKNKLANDLGFNLIRINVNDNLTKSILDLVQRPSKA